MTLYPTTTTTTVFYLSVKLPLNILRIKILQVWIQLNKPFGNKLGVRKTTKKALFVGQPSLVIGCKKKRPSLVANQV